MTTPRLAVPASALALLLGLIAARSPVVSATAPGHVESSDEPLASSGSADQVDVGLTVYNGGLALVRDVRNVNLPTGAVQLRFEDIAATVNPATVHLRSLSHPGLLLVHEQNYEYDLLDPQKLLQKYVGKQVTLVRTTFDNGATKTIEVSATLLALNGGPVWKIGAEIVTGIGADHFRFPEVPDSLYSRPTLVWALDNQGPRRQKIETAYLANSIGWSSDYVLTLDKSGSTGDLDGWVTLKNNTGTPFKNARLQLVAGELHKVENDVGRRNFSADAMKLSEAREEMVQQAFSDYHLYTLGRRTSINNAETKQLALLNGRGVPMRKRFVVNSQQWYYRNRKQPGTPIKDSVKVYYDFTNNVPSNLGMPMPAGVVRVYQADPEGRVQYIGEDRIGHTPKDEALSVQIGTAFDVVCERRQTDFQDLGGSNYELAYEVIVRNRKDSGVAVELNEPFGGDWTMISSSHRWTKTEAWAARFTAPVAAGGEARVRYRVRVKW